MTGARDQAAREVRLARMRGASPEAAARLKHHNAQCQDWAGRCRKCGAARQGALGIFGASCEECGHGG